MTSLVPLNNIAHRHLKMNLEVDYQVTQEKHMMSVFVSEFVLACAEYPLVFVKAEETSQMQSVILTGLKPKQNLFYSEKQGWLGKYVPASTRSFPLLVLQNNESESEMLVCIDQNSDRISETVGEALFETNGEQSDFLKTQIETATDLRRHAQQTQLFIEKLNELELIKSHPLSVRPKGEEAYNLLGLYVIDDQRLSKLDEKQFLELRELGYLSAIYASLSSLYRLDHLVQRQASFEKK